MYSARFPSRAIHYYQIGEWELFDLQDDPDELQNAYNNPDYSEIRENLKSELEKLREHYEVPQTDPID